MQLKNLRRTQVMLTPELITMIEKARKIAGESRSAYLRKAALLRLSQEKKRKGILENLADTLIGSISLRRHPIWKDAPSIEKWLEETRSEWR